MAKHTVVTLKVTLAELAMLLDSVELDLDHMHSYVVLYPEVAEYKRSYLALNNLYTAVQEEFLAKGGTIELQVPPANDNEPALPLE